MPKQKLRKFAELKEMDFVFQYPYAVLEREPFPYKGAWGEQVFETNQPITIELGCGGGEYTVALAETTPSGNFIGIDRKGARMWLGGKRTIEKGLKNVAFLRTDIDLINRFFAPEEVSNIWITFPDPMMQRTRRRLISSVYLEKYRQLLAPESVISLKTDSPFLYHYTLDLLGVNGIEPIAAREDLYASCEEALRATLPNVRTRYEEQWISRGMSIKFVAFTLPAGKSPFVEPPQEPPRDNYRSLCVGSALLKDLRKDTEPKS